MTTDFNYLTFSVFDISDFKLFTDAVEVIFKKQLRTGKAELNSETPNPSGWVNPESGGAHLPVFTILYLRSIGFKVDNSLFARHSWYFRNALVRANYKNVLKGADYSPEYLERFFRNRY